MVLVKGIYGASGSGVTIGRVPSRRARSRHSAASERTESSSPQVAYCSSASATVSAYCARLSRRMFSSVINLEISILTS